jgi:hypothetical protein
MTMLVTMKSSELIDKLLMIAHGDSRLVDAAILASSTGPQGEADLKDVVDYIISHRVPEPVAA